MPLLINCKECGSQLKLPDVFAGRRGRCPRCASVFDIAPAAGAEPAPRRAAAPRTAVTERAPSRAAAVDDRQPEAEEGTEEAPRRKKKKRKKQQQPSGVPTWVWWLIAGSGAALCMLTFFIVILLGMKTEALAYVLMIVILLPISTVILIISMFISSAVAGGIDFGDARVAIPKAAALLLIVNSIGLFCGFAGSILTFPVWLFGLMSLFRLDLWEARVLVAINWGLNFLARMAVTSVILSLLAAGGGIGVGEDVDDGDDREPDLPNAVQVEKPDPVQVVSQLGGKCKVDNTPEQAVIEVNLSRSQVTDEDLAVLQEFSKLRVLDLSGTAITDAGLNRLTGMFQLQKVNLSKTRVTKGGIERLQRAIPRTKIIP
jgi:hypothetical protein